MDWIAMATGFILILMGLYGALTNRNILRIIVSFSVANTGVNLVLVAVGYMRGRTAPILDEAVPMADAVTRIIDPLPQALVLTAIVIGLGVTALMLTYAYKLYEEKGTLDISKCRDLKW
ncbi:multicomponent Na+:H+ antiporter subunit C [Thiothrix caldifontis]|jgi:Multisubunit Na+/H+ antiporter, MnhC subunit|uniref:Multicomponent Na+:H+ antiporter subunit C n=3 Tax=Thiothrix TaxID=1030 RepID=A0A1H4G1Q4_9GAMM|nr:MULTISPECIES: NADH-quinone oxidoreductase subunit K [Thiothrix]MDX9989525.1 NADH-quinone oxidoreductase subunit K [Thiothrix unzii]OQX14650.1 MAG: cation:proton antiporter [Thiothrix lacustris]QTR55161.1 NADH-quinone oxidoreductase subunit K [Thiothrix unzii]SEB02990.1 multicomponent Na+:H+ antiporter subunit C [Thiothrix caldifontis]